MQIQKINSELSVQASPTIMVGAVYKHYSGKLYKVLSIARDSEDITLMRVVYQGLYECPTFGHNPIWVRPYSMFAENVIIDEVEQPRFSFMTSTDTSEDLFQLGVKTIIKNDELILN